MLLSERLRQMREAAAPKEKITAAVLLRGRTREPKTAARKGRVKAPAFVAWMHTQPCLVATKGFGGCSGAITFHHLRRFGGQKDDRVGLALCEAHHMNGAGPDAIHRRGKAAFQAQFGIDIEAEAARYLERWRAETRQE